MYNKQQTIVVKIGTAALSRKDNTVDTELLGSIVAELVALKQDGHHVVLVTSGAVGTGRTRLRDDAFPQCCDEVTRKQIQASVGQPRLMGIYQQLLDAVANSGMEASQSLLTKEHFGNPQHLVRMLSVIKDMPNVLPVMNENDSVAIQEFFTDNDELSGDLSKLIGANKLIILSSIDGIYDRNPEDPDARRFWHIDASSFDSSTIDTHGKTPTGRGGGDSKVKTSFQAALDGIIVHVASSREPRVITRIMNNEAVGTRIDTVLAGEQDQQHRIKAAQTIIDRIMVGRVSGFEA